MHGCFTLIYVVCAPHMCSACKGSKRALDALGLELQMVMNHLVGSGNQAGVLWKSIQLLSHLFSTLVKFFKLHVYLSMLCVCVGHICLIAHVRRPEYKWELVLSFQHVSSED